MLSIESTIHILQGVTNQSFNAMSTHVSCLSLVNSPAGLHTVRSRSPTDVHRGVETGMV